jgi:hypothetical protein
VEVKVFAVRVGNRYGPEYEDYLRSKIPNIEFLTQPEPDLIWQWNKMHFFNYDCEEPIVVIDVDIELHNNYMDLINYPIEHGQFLTLNPWWDPNKNCCDINGGFYKFYPQDTKYIYEEFMSNPNHWRRHWIELGIKPGPTGGEENFVSLMASKKLEIVYAPEQWYTRFVSNHDNKWLVELNNKYPGSYAYLDQFNPDIKLVHYNQLGNILVR